MPTAGLRCGTFAVLFLKLGTAAFGGPAAHIAMMDEEVVRRRRWPLTALERGCRRKVGTGPEMLSGPSNIASAIDKREAPRSLEVRIAALRAISSERGLDPAWRREVLKTIVRVLLSVAVTGREGFNGNRNQPNYLSTMERGKVKIGGGDPASDQSGVCEEC